MAVTPRWFVYVMVMVMVTVPGVVAYEFFNVNVFYVSLVGLAMVGVVIFLETAVRPYFSTDAEYET